MVIQLVGEGFRRRFNAGADPDTHMSWVGTLDPRLTIADSSVAYAHIDPVVNAGAVVGYLPSFTLPNTVTIVAQVRFPNGDADIVSIGIHRGNNATIAGGRFVSVEVPAGGGWHMVTGTIRMDNLPEYADFAAAALAGTVFVFAATSNFSGTQPALDVSFLGLGARPRPLRWRQGNDGIRGGSPEAARGVTSQQGSNRNRGYL